MLGLYLLEHQQYLMMEGDGRHHLIWIVLEQFLVLPGLFEHVGVHGLDLLLLSGEQVHDDDSGAAVPVDGWQD